MSLKFQKRLEAQRAENARKDILKQELKENKRLLETNLWQAKGNIDQNRRQERLEELKRLRELRQQIINQEKQKLIETQNLESLKQKELGKKKQNKSLNWNVEQDERIRDLKSKINELYVRKSQADQLKVKAEMNILQRKEEAITDAQYLESIAEQEKELQKRERSYKSKSEELRKAIIEQIDMREKQLLEEEQRVVADEKERIDSVVAELYEEQARQRQIEFLRRAQTREDIENNWALSLKGKEEHDKLLQQEAKAREAYAKKIEERESKRNEGRKELHNRFEIIYAKLLTKHLHIKEKEEALIEAREVIHLYELNSKLDAELEKKKQQQAKQREDLVKAYEEHMRRKEIAMAQALLEKENLHRIYKQNLQELETIEKEAEKKIIEKKKKLRDVLRAQIRAKENEQNIRMHLEEEQDAKKAKDKEAYEIEVKSRLEAIIADNKKIISLFGNAIK